jgi:pimeloyl-ACP methyl ester carboxylesterase
MDRAVAGALSFVQACALSCLLAAAVTGQAQEKPAIPDTAKPSLQYVTVHKDLKLEVIDWGGTGQPLVFLAGLGNDTHVFDSFAPQSTAKYHVYGITRRGYGKSDVPPTTVANYRVERLGQDVLDVMEELKLERPVLVGHSIAGEELSWIGSEHPEKVAGLAYLDAGYEYAYHDMSQNSSMPDLGMLRRELDAVTEPTAPKGAKGSGRGDAADACPGAGRATGASNYARLDTGPAARRATVPIAGGDSRSALVHADPRAGAGNLCRSACNGVEGCEGGGRGRGGM